MREDTHQSESNAIIDKIISNRSKGSSIGFNAQVSSPDDRRTGDVLREVEPEDLLKFGLIPEFVGRLPVLATLEDLDEEVILTLIERAEESLLEIALTEMDDEEVVVDKKPEQLIEESEYLSKEQIDLLNKNDIKNIENLADLATDELVEILSIEEGLAGKIIMNAREEWFED